MSLPSSGSGLATLALTLLCGPALVRAIVPADEVKSFPGFEGPLPARQWNGYLEVDGSVIPGNQTFHSHYTLVESQRPGGDLLTDPLVIWQQGGPGSSGYGYGYFAELGPFQLTAESLSANKSGIPTPFLNPHSWDHLANLLIFEHPPGTGFSYCENEVGSPVTCEWNDQTAGVAFYHTLLAFYKAYPEFEGKDLYIIGESYAGLLIPFVVQQIAAHEPNNPFTLKSFAVGNGCPGTSGSTPENRGSCNGPYGSYDTQHVVELAYGHGAVSRQLYNNITRECKFPCESQEGWAGDCQTFSKDCEMMLNKFHQAVGPFNIYNFYDNCGGGNSVPVSLSASQHRNRLDNAVSPTQGGETYPCGTGDAAITYLNIPAVREALHLKPESFYGHPWALGGGNLSYTTYTGSSFDLYPDLLKRYRALVYNGDADACVPFNSNEDWVVALGLPTKTEWHPWTLDGVVAGYVTSYSTSGPADFTFLTIKEAGHMVPQYQPERALAFFERWLNDEEY